MGIAIDPIGGIVYATENGNDPDISGDTDGSNPHQLIFVPNGDPLGLAIDTGANKIYWTDNGSHAVFGANLDGTNVHSIISFDTGASGQTPNFWHSIWYQPSLNPPRSRSSPLAPWGWR